MTKLKRKTKETAITCNLEVRGSGQIDVTTGVGFFDHMLISLAAWAGWDLDLDVQGDLEVDSHHTVEDAAIVLGQALYREWSKDTAIERVGSALLPMDDALAQVALDLCNRPYFVYQAELGYDRIGNFETYLAQHFFRSLAQEGRFTLNISNLSGTDPHHIIEAQFKGLGLALRQALQPRQGWNASTKGSL